MKARVIGIVVALVLGITGTLVLMAYVRSVRDDAVADETLVSVYVVTEMVPAGTPLGDVIDRVELVDVPERLVAPETVSDLSTLTSDLVAAVELRPGEQLLTSRLLPPRDLTRVEPPAGLQELTVALDAERALGGALEPGDTVGIIISFDPLTLSEAGLLVPTTTTTLQPLPEGATTTTTTTTTTLQPLPEGATTTTTTTTTLPPRTPKITNLVFHQVLVTAVQYSQSDADLVTEQEDRTPDDVGVGPTNQVYVTLAVTGAQAEQVVFGAEFGLLWLTSENALADTDGTRIVTLSEFLDGFLDGDVAEIEVVDEESGS